MLIKTVHCPRLKRFDIPNIAGEEKLIAPMMNDGSKEIRDYVIMSYNNLFVILISRQTEVKPVLCMQSILQE